METQVTPVSKTISDAKSIFTSANSLFKKVGKKETGPNKSYKNSSLNPEDIALKVLADVAPQREAVEQLQKASFFQSQKQTHKLRIEQSQQRLKSSPDNCSYSSNSANSSRHASPSCDSTSSNNTMCPSIGVNRCTPSTSGSSPSSLTPNATTTAGFKNYSPESFKYSDSFSPTLHRNMTEKSNNAMLPQENLNVQDMSGKNFASAGPSFNSLSTNLPNEQQHRNYTSSTSSSKENRFERLMPDNFSLLLHSYNNQPNRDLNYVTDAKPPIPAKPQLRATQNSAFKSLPPSTEDKLKLRGGDKKPVFKSKESNHVQGSFQKVVIHSQDLPKPSYKLATFPTFNSDPLQFCSSPEYSVLENSVHMVPADKTALKFQENVLHTTVSDTRNTVCSSSDLEIRKRAHYQEGNSAPSSQFSIYVHSDNESMDSDANFTPFRQKSTKKGLDKWSSDPSVLHSDHPNTFTDSLTPSEPHEAKSTQKKVCFKEKSLSSPLVAEEFTPQTYGPLGHFYFSEFPKSPSSSSNTALDKNFSTKHQLNNPDLPSWSKQTEFSPHSKHSDKRTIINQPPATQVVDYPNQYSHHSSFPGPQTLQPSLLNTAKSEKTLLERLSTNHKKSKIVQISKC